MADMVSILRELIQSIEKKVKCEYCLGMGTLEVGKRQQGFQSTLEGEGKPSGQSCPHLIK